MKFRAKEFIGGVIVGSLFFSGISYATSNVKLIVDGREIKSDVPSQIINGRAMVPARDMAQALGAKVDWDASSNAVVVSSKEDQLYEVPGNINPIFVLFKYISADASVSVEQFKDIKSGKLFVEELKNAASDVQLKEFREVARKNGQIEFETTFKIKRNKGYNGAIVEGENKLYFIVEKSGDMEFKIVSSKNVPQLLNESYINSVDKYSLSLPSEWSKVRIVEEKRNTDFIYPSAVSNNQQSLFRIVAMTEKEFETLKANDELAIGQLKEITRNQGSIYFYILPLDMVLEGNELKQYEEMAKQIPTIIKSLKF